MTDKFICPQRQADVMRFPVPEGGDWESGEKYWSLDHEAQIAKNKAKVENNRYPDGTPGLIMDVETCGCWFWSWGPPRICHYCGGVHPDDALRLLQDGWDHERAKAYKGYLWPPGSNQAREIWAKTGFKRGPSVWSPTPQVKFYSYHCTDAQLAAINEELAKRKNKE